jgi:hypothetical protein
LPSNNVVWDKGICLHGRRDIISSRLNWGNEVPFPIDRHLHT